jgi:histidinol-phosphate aminotransferase
VCGAGSDELIALIVRAFAGPGDEVLYSAHGFLMYKLAALGAGAHPVVAPEKDARADVEALLRAVTSRTKLVFIANPNNPTGSYLTGEELERLREGLPHDVVLVVDAAYAEFVTAADYSSGLELATSLTNTIMTRTFSKLYGLASLRIGWMVSSPHVVDIVNRVRGPFNVSQPAQAAALAALEDLEHQELSRRHNEEWLAGLAREIEAAGFHVYPSVGNFLLVRFPTTPGRTAEDAAHFLENEGILPRMMHAYGLPECLRLSIGLESDNRRMVEALKAFARGAKAA